MISHGFFLSLISNRMSSKVTLISSDGARFDNVEEAVAKKSQLLKNMIEGTDRFT